MLRKRMLKERASIDLNWKAEYDSEICTLLIDIVREREAQVVHCYLPLEGEIDPTSFLKNMLKAKVKIICPKTLINRNLDHIVLDQLGDKSEGLYGTYFPSSGMTYRGKYDIIVVPGLAFSPSGNRLGYGGGYYDQFLSKNDSAYSVGVAYPFQILDNIPTEEHDITLDKVLHFTAL